MQRVIIHKPADKCIIKFQHLIFLLTTSIYAKQTHPAVGQVVDLLADVGDISFRLVVHGTTRDVPIGLGQTQD